MIVLVLFLGINKTSCGAKGVLVFLESVELFGPVEPLCQVKEASIVFLCSVFFSKLMNAS